jgi:hypothetical protein
VISGGVTYVGRQDLLPTMSPYTWVNLSSNDNYPGPSVCGVGVSTQGNDLWVQVLTTGGQVWQTHCNVPGTTLTCTGAWVQQKTPSTTLSAPNPRNGSVPGNGPNRRTGPLPTSSPSNGPVKEPGRS